VAPENLSEDLLRVEPLTGFGDREKLFDDLAKALETASPPSVLVVLSLDGLDDYRELFGRLDATTLVVGLAERLVDIFGDGVSLYWAREDEFAAIVPGSLDPIRAQLEKAVAALHEPGKYVSVTAAYGTTTLPDEATTPIEALIIADEQVHFAGGGRKSRERRRNLRT
jgi:GGDEF domain-containing protein